MGEEGPDEEGEDFEPFLRPIVCRCGGGDPGCEMCDGGGTCYEMVIPERERHAIFENIMRQLPGRKH